MAGKKEAKRKAGPVKKKSIEKKQKVLRQQRTPQRRAGRMQPKENSHRADKNRGLKRAPKASGGSTQRTSKKAGRLSRK